MLAQLFPVGIQASGQRGDGCYSAQKAAELLNVHVSTISEWRQEGRLESIRSAPMGPRWIKLTPEIIAELRKPIRRRWSRPISTSAGEAASDYNKKLMPEAECRNHNSG